jgi:hypothetical protein
MKSHMQSCVCSLHKDEIRSPSSDHFFHGLTIDCALSFYEEIIREGNPSNTVVHYLRWIPHCLSDGQNGIRVNLSRELLPVLEPQYARGWDDIVTLDESWFCFSLEHEWIWLAPEEQVLTKNGTWSSAENDDHGRLEFQGIPYHDHVSKRYYIRYRLL